MSVTSTAEPSERPYITCQELIEFLADYVAGELPSEQQFEFVRHLRVCPSCVAYLDTYKETTRMSRAALLKLDSVSAIPDEVPEELVLAVMKALPRPPALGGEGE